MEGRKTQTRRIMDPQPYINAENGRWWWPCDDVQFMVYMDSEMTGGTPWEGFPGSVCPKGDIGDLLWVRETWQAVHYHRDWESGIVDEVTHSEKIPKLNDNWWDVAYAATDPFAEDPPEERGFPWRPNIHMPRWASRITLRITDVRVQRLQDISEEDAILEGARKFDDIPVVTPFKYGEPDRWSMEQPENTDQCLGSPIGAFANYINKLHGGKNWNCKPGPSLWDRNEWVWAISFDVINKNVDQVLKEAA